MIVSAAACGAPPMPVAQAIPSATQRTPLPTPATRTAPTLPPEYTATNTATPSDTPTPSHTPTPTPTPNVETICTTISWTGDSVRDREFADDYSYLFSVVVGWRESVADLSWRNVETDEGDQVLIPGGTTTLMDIADMFGPGTHEIKLKVITNVYPAICEDSAQFTILPLITNTPVPTDTSTPTATVRMTATFIPSPTATQMQEVTVEDLLIEILILIRDRLSEED